MTSLLTLSADIRQNEIFKEKSGNFTRIFTVDQHIFLSQQNAGHLAGDRACMFMSHILTRASNFSFIFVLCHK